MAAAGILKVFDDIKSSNGHYCSVCYHTASERRLVEPVYLKKFINKMKTGVPFRKRVKVCYICEALAKSGERFCNAVLLAGKVADLYEDVKGSGQWPEVVKCITEARHLGQNYDSVLYGKHGNTVLRRAAQLDKLLQSSPRNELSRTDTLVVGNGAEPKAKKPPEPDSDDVMIIENDAVDPLPTNEVPDDEVVLVENPPSQHLSNISVLPDQMKVRVANNDSNDIILHPMVFGTDGNVYVPSLQLQKIGDGVFKNVPPDHIQNCLPSQMNPPNGMHILESILTNHGNLIGTTLNKNFQTSTTLSKNAIQTGTTLSKNPIQTGTTLSKNPIQTGTTLSKNPIQTGTTLSKNAIQTGTTLSKNAIETATMNNEKEKNKRMESIAYYNFIQSQRHVTSNVNGINDVQTNGLNIVLNSNERSKKRRKTEDPLSLESESLSDVEHILNENTKGGCEIKYMTDESNPAGVALTESRRPVLSTDRTVDWEDKIPMDVISFMDATDPNPEERIMQPPRPVGMGFISNVRSLPDDDVQARHIEWVDLC